jgi:hypothetical protein
MPMYIKIKMFFYLNIKPKEKNNLKFLIINYFNDYSNKLHNL